MDENFVDDEGVKLLIWLLDECLDCVWWSCICMVEWIKCVDMFSLWEIVGVFVCLVFGKSGWKRFVFDLGGSVKGEFWGLVDFYFLKISFVCVGYSDCV